MEKKIKEITDFIAEGYSGLTAIELYEAQFFTPEECIAMSAMSEDYEIYKIRRSEYEGVYDSDD